MHTPAQSHSDGQSHSHSSNTPSHSDAAAAARAQRDATVIGWVDGVPVPRARLAERVAELRTGRLAGRLPAAGSKEDRQFWRWTAQVLLTEELCRMELARLKGNTGPVAEVARLGENAGSAAEFARLKENAGSAAETVPAPTTTRRVLTQAESLHLGSINAAAWSACPAVAELFDLVTSPTTPAWRPKPRRTWYRVMHSMAATPLAADTATPRSLGWTTLDDLPAPLATELRAVPTGIRVGPLRSGLGWHVATVVATQERADPRPGSGVVSGSTDPAGTDPASTDPAGTDPAGTDPPRLAAFNRWLDERRRALVRLAPGFEHPGDPRQPDNTHRH